MHLYLVIVLYNNIWSTSNNKNQIFANYSLQFAKVSDKFAEHISASLHLLVTQLILKKCCSGGEQLSTLLPIWPAPRFETQTSSSRDKGVTTGLLNQ